MRVLKHCFLMLLILICLSYESVALAVELAHGSQMPYLLVTKEEYQKARGSVFRGEATSEEVSSLLENGKKYITDNYDEVFYHKSGRTGNIDLLFFGFKSGLVVEAHTRYNYFRHGKILSGDLSSGWVVQYDDLDHTVTYKCIKNNGHLDIIDHETKEQFFSDYKHSNIEYALEALYPKYY